MEDEQSKKNQETEDNKDAVIKPDPETLDTTDPQEHMEGPVSTLMHKVLGSFGDHENNEKPEKEEK